MNNAMNNAMSKPTPKYISIDYISVDNYLWETRRRLMRKYGTDESYRDIAPLSWYIGTGRASTDFLRALLSCKPFMIARKLHEGGSYEEVIQRVKEYISNATGATDL